MAGRKGLGEELQIKRRFAELTEPFFHALKGFLESEDKNDRKFAVQELNKGFTKMIPTQISGEEGGAIVIHVAKEVAEAEKLYDTPQNASGDSTGSA